MAVKNFTSNSLSGNYGTMPKGQPLKSGKQVAPGKGTKGMSPYPNGTSKGKK